MHKTFLIVLILSSLLSINANLYTAQSNQATVTLLDRKDQATTQITDGDTVRIQVTLSQPVQSAQNITFTLEDPSLQIATCAIPSGKDGCTTDPFPALGWYWDSQGAAQSPRTLHASTALDQPALGSSPPVSVSPRPVVLVHGFISNWQTWNNYLGPRRIRPA